jgi:hypothetical protein
VLTGRFNVEPKAGDDWLVVVGKHGATDTPLFQAASRQSCPGISGVMKDGVFLMESRLLTDDGIVTLLRPGHGAYHFNTSMFSSGSAVSLEDSLKTASISIELFADVPQLPPDVVVYLWSARVGEGREQGIPRMDDAQVFHLSGAKSLVIPGVLPGAYALCLARTEHTMDLEAKIAKQSINYLPGTVHSLIVSEGITNVGMSVGNAVLK